MYVTKFALTDGIRHVECRPTSSVGYVLPQGLYNSAKVGKDVHETREAAEKRFEQMRAAAIKSAEKRLARLRAMTFEVKGEA